MTRVLLDCDGVMSNFVDAACEFIYQATGTRYFPEEIFDHDTFGFLGLKHLERDLKEEIEQHDWCLNMRPFPGARRGVQRLSKYADIVVVTAPYHANGWVMQRNEWLRRYMKISEVQVVYAENKGLVSGDFFVDDKVENCVEWSTANPNGMAIVWNRPYNGGKDAQGFVRVNTWEALENIIASQHSS